MSALVLFEQNNKKKDTSEEASSQTEGKVITTHHAVIYFTLDLLSPIIKYLHHHILTIFIDINNIYCHLYQAVYLQTYCSPPIKKKSGISP